MVLIINLLGCTSWKKNDGVIEITTKPLPRAPLALSLPDPLSLSSIEWIIITPANAEEVFAKLKEKNVDVILFGLTDSEYQTLSLNTAELRMLIAQQRDIIINYQKYYEPKE